MSDESANSATPTSGATPASAAAAPPLAVGRIVAALVAVALLATAVVEGLDARRGFRDFDDWRTARPVQMTVDASRPGTIAGTLRQTCHVAHGESFLLVVEERPADGERLESLRIDGKLVVHDANGDKIVSTPLHRDISRDRLGSSAFEIAYVHPFADGEYRTTLEITRGDDRLAGRTQRLEARYRLCGMELWPATLQAAFAGLCGLVGAPTAWIVGHGFWRQGWRRRPRPADPAAPSAD